MDLTHLGLVAGRLLDLQIALVVLCWESLILSGSCGWVGSTLLWQRALVLVIQMPLRCPSHLLSLRNLWGSREFLCPGKALVVCVMRQLLCLLLLRRWTLIAL